MKYHTDYIGHRHDSVVIYYFLALSFSRDFYLDSQIRDLRGQDIGTLPPGLKCGADAF